MNYGHSNIIKKKENPDQPLNKFWGFWNVQCASVSEIYRPLLTPRGEIYAAQLCMSCVKILASERLQIIFFK